MRFFGMALAILTAPLLPSILLAAPPDYSGTWQMNSAQSQATDDQAITLTIHESADKIDFTRVVHEKDGKEVTSKFSCATGGTQCDFDEGNHKAKVSLWYDGPTLVILKTDGPKEDSTHEMRLQLAPDGKTLNVDSTQLEPKDKTVKIVFEKTS
jgi:hypothetical protein